MFKGIAFVALFASGTTAACTGLSVEACRADTTCLVSSLNVCLPNVDDYETAFQACVSTPLANCTSTDCESFDLGGGAHECVLKNTTFCSRKLLQDACTDICKWTQKELCVANRGGVSSSTGADSGGSAGGSCEASACTANVQADVMAALSGSGAKVCPIIQTAFDCTRTKANCLGLAKEKCIEYSPIASPLCSLDCEKLTAVARGGTPGGASGGASGSCDLNAVRACSNPDAFNEQVKAGKVCLAIQSTLDCSVKAGCTDSAKTTCQQYKSLFSSVCTVDCTTLKSTDAKLSGAASASPVLAVVLSAVAAFVFRA